MNVLGVYLSVSMQAAVTQMVLTTVTVIAAFLEMVLCNAQVLLTLKHSSLIFSLILFLTFKQVNF